MADEGLLLNVLVSRVVSLPIAARVGFLWLVLQDLSRHHRLLMIDRASFIFMIVDDHFPLTRLEASPLMGDPLRFI